jgi:hypothetical protein
MSLLEKILPVLKEYKELVTALAFFAGGILWVFGYFATKDELHALRDGTSAQNKLVICLLEKHVQLLEGEQVAKISRDDLIVVMTELSKQKPRRAQFSENDINNVVKLEQQRDDIKKKLDAAEKTILAAKESIMFRACEK